MTFVHMLTQEAATVNWTSQEEDFVLLYYPTTGSFCPPGVAYTQSSKEQITRSMLSTRLSRIVLMVRGNEGVVAATNFYHKALGLSVQRVTDEWAEIHVGSGSDSLTLHLQATYAEGSLSTGYSPLLTFEVANMDETITACAQAGAHLDGPIQYPAYGKVASLRAPDGHMIAPTPRTIIPPPPQQKPTPTATFQQQQHQNVFGNNHGNRHLLMEG
eukprot:scaffold1808_cov158-Amphora_coffeaeformis.AAC.3